MIGLYPRQSCLTAIHRAQVCSKGCNISINNSSTQEKALEPSMLIVKPTAIKVHSTPAKCASDVAVLTIPGQKQPFGKVNPWSHSKLVSFKGNELPYRIALTIRHLRYVGRAIDAPAHQSGYTEPQLRPNYLMPLQCHMCLQNGSKN